MVLNIKILRLQRNQTQAETSHALLISLRGYRRIENGEGQPRLKTAIALEQIFGKSISYLLEPYNKPASSA